MLGLLDRHHQGNPQLFGADVLQGEFRCHECGDVLANLGTELAAGPIWRCTNPDCDRAPSGRSIPGIEVKES